MTEDQASDKFFEIVGGDADWAMAAAEQAPKQELPPVKPTGLSYTGDTVTGTGEPLSGYVFTWEGVRLFNVYVDLSVDLPVPPGCNAVKAHPIRVQSLDALHSIDTNGMALVAKHDDGLVHVDGTTVLTYIAPRLMRYMVALYVK
jgi:hypothetical protein